MSWQSSSQEGLKLGLQRQFVCKFKLANKASRHIATCGLELPSHQGLAAVHKQLSFLDRLPTIYVSSWHTAAGANCKMHSAAGANLKMQNAPGYSHLRCYEHDAHAPGIFLIEVNTNWTIAVKLMLSIRIPVRYSRADASQLSLRHSGWLLMVVHGSWAVTGAAAGRNRLMVQVPTSLFFSLKHALHHSGARSQWHTTGLFRVYLWRKYVCYSVSFYKCLHVFVNVLLLFNHVDDQQFNWLKVYNNWVWYNI